jgi:cyclophilin family peptidyl-prolyl cis-trans isomerase
MIEALHGYAEIAPLSEVRVLEFAGPGQVTAAGLEYRALLETSQGNLVLSLDQEAAPETVNSFCWLVLHRFYDGVPFHRVIAEFMAQTGDPTGTGTGGPGYQVPLEVRPGKRFDRPGVLGMARSQSPNSGGSQFFITYGPSPHLDGAYTVFGRLVEGLEVLRRLKKVEGGRGGPPDQIVRAVLYQRAG